MANFSLVSNAKFRPFSYQEMLQPLQAYTNEYNTIQEGIGELGTKAGVFEKLANEQTDPKAYSMYKQYADDLTQQVESLAKQGLSPASRQGLINMKRRYSSEILPIEQAYTRRQALADEQRKASLQDSTLLFDRLAQTISLDEFINNPTLSPQSYSGAAITKQVGIAAQALAKEVRENPNKWKPILGNQYFEGIQQRGFRPEEILRAIQGNPKASGVLRGIVEDAVGSTGIGRWNNRESLENAYKYAGQGLWQAVGDTQYQTLSNKAYDYAMKEQLAKSKAKKGEETQSNPTFRSQGILRVKANTDNLRQELKFIRGISEGSIDLNAKVERPKKITDPMDLMGTRGHLQDQYGEKEEYSPNQEKLAEIVKKYGTKDLTAISDRISGDINKSVMRENSYITNITDNSLIAKTIKENAITMLNRGGEDYGGIYDLDGTEKGRVTKEKDIQKYFTSNSFISYEPGVGLIFTGTDKDNKTKRFLLDPEVVTGETTDRTPDNVRRNIYQNQIDLIDRAIEAGDFNAQESLIHGLMGNIYSRFNTVAKTQSSTDAKI